MPGMLKDVSGRSPNDRDRLLCRTGLFLIALRIAADAAEQQQQQLTCRPQASLQQFKHNPMRILFAQGRPY